MRRESRRPMLGFGVCCSCWQFGGCKLWVAVVLPTFRLPRGRVLVSACSGSLLRQESGETCARKCSGTARILDTPQKTNSKFKIQIERVNKFTESSMLQLWTPNQRHYTYHDLNYKLKANIKLQDECQFMFGHRARFLENIITRYATLAFRVDSTKPNGAILKLAQLCLNSDIDERIFSVAYLNTEKEKRKSKQHFGNHFLEMPCLENPLRPPPPPRWGRQRSGKGRETSPGHRSETCT